MEVEVVFVIGPVDSLEVADDILTNVGRKWLGGLDLVVGGCVESEDPSGGGDDLMVGEGVNMEIKQVVIVTHVRLFDWVDLERSEASADIRWGDPFLASDGGAGITKHVVFRTLPFSFLADYII